MAVSTNDSCLGDAAHHQSCDAAPPVGSHHHQVRFIFPRRARNPGFRRPARPRDMRALHPTAPAPHA